MSRGGLKLAAALEHWQIDVASRNCLDVGASTGGFTDCLLQHGAAHVTAVDTGFGQIAMKLRTDPRVRLMERTNARLLEPGSLAGSPEPTLLVMDVSFISATLVLPPVIAAAPDLHEAVVLVKPQFEAGREHVGKGGIVRDPEAHQLAIDRVAACFVDQGWQVVGNHAVAHHRRGREPGVSAVRETKAELAALPRFVRSSGQCAFHLLNFFNLSLFTERCSLTTVIYTDPA